MLEAWRNIDSMVAEAQLRGLRRRLSELDDALRDQQALARENPQSFAIWLSGRSLLAMEAALRREMMEILRHRQAEHLAISLNGPRYDNHTAQLSDLGVIFTRIQKLFSSIAQAITTGPTTRGPLRSDIVALTTMRLQGTYASSFGLNVAVYANYDLLGNSLPSETLNQLFQLLSATKDDARLMQIAGEVGRRSLIHLRHLARHLKATDTSISVDWKDFAGTEHAWNITKENTNQIISTIDNITETRAETVSVGGLLVGASLLRNRFEILVDNDLVLEGKFVTGLAPTIQDAFGKRITAIVDETEVLDRVTGMSKTFYSLKAIEPA